MAATSTTATVDRAAIRAQMGKERLLKIYQQMLLVRRFEERAGDSYTKLKIAGFLHMYIGQEAVAGGFYDHLEGGKDYSVTSYRCHAQALFLGIDPKELMAELYGKITGNVRGKGGSMHFFSKEKGYLGGHGIVGGQIPVGTGAAFTAKYRKTGGVSVTFLGDGAVPQGTFHESLNMASLWNLPAIYVIENNMYGMGTACSRSVAVQDMAAAKAPGYNMKSWTIRDGLDLFECWAVAKEVVTYARTGKPALVEAKTYRYRGHSVSDLAADGTKPTDYRTKAEIERYQQLDPIARVKKDLIEAGWLTDAGAEQIDEQIQTRVREAVQFADESPEPPLDELGKDVYAK